MTDAVAQVEDRRRSLLAAKVNLEAARVEAAKHANVYSRDGEDKIRFACQQAQLMSSRRWYNFWEKASREPKTLQLSDGESLDWSTAADRALAEVKAAAAADAPGFEAAYTKSGASVQYAQRRTDNGAQLLRVTKAVAVAPRVVLLTQIRAAQAGLADSSLLYMREHYMFRGGRTMLLHHVKSMNSAFVSPRDYVTLLTWEEDDSGVITVAAKSVENSLARGIVPGTVRAQRLTFGMQIRPQTVTKKASLFGGRQDVDGCEITMVSNTAFKGFMPAFMQKSYALNEVLAFLGSLESVGDKLEKEGLALELVARFVERAGEDDEEQAQAASKAAEAEAEAKAEAEEAAKVGIDVEKEVGKISEEPDVAVVQPDNEVEPSAA